MTKNTFYAIPGLVARTDFRNEKRGVAAACTYSMGMLSFVVTGLMLVFDFGDTTSAVASLAIPTTAHCLRIRRSADYVVVLLPIGDPPREAELLFRPDKVVDEAGVFILGTANSQSIRLNCSATLCTDIAILQSEGPMSNARVGVVRYTFVAHAVDDSVGGSWLGLDGEFSIVRGYTYWLTASHLCWETTNLSTTPDASLSFPAKTNLGCMITTSSFAGPRECNSSEVKLFPVSAAHERSFLGLSSNYLYEHANERVEERRADAEKGILCGGTSTAYSRDCLAAGTCHVTPSAPYRRLVSSSFMAIQAHHNDAVVALQPTNTLSRISGLLSVNSVVLIGILRLLLMILAAVVAYVRSSQISSNSVAMLLRAANGTPAEAELPFTMANVLLDAGVGIVAVLARLVVLVAMKDSLSEDGLGVVVVSEAIGVGASVVHFVLRHTMQFDWNYDVPLTKLGGSMALVDTAMAILVVFADAPVLGNQVAFSGIGRMLGALLICISCLPLAIFAAVACGVTYADIPTQKTAYYEGWWFLAVIAWLLQLMTIGLTLGYCFAGPLAYQLVRTSSGGSTRARLVVFSCAIMTSLPAQHRVVLQTILALAKDKKS